MQSRAALCQVQVRQMEERHLCGRECAYRADLEEADEQRGEEGELCIRIGAQHVLLIDQSEIPVGLSKVLSVVLWALLLGECALKADLDQKIADDEAQRKAELAAIAAAEKAAADAEAAALAAKAAEKKKKAAKAEAKSAPADAEDEDEEDDE